MVKQEVLEAAFEMRDEGIGKEFKNVDERLDRSDAAVQPEFQHIYPRFIRPNAAIQREFQRVYKRLERVNGRLQEVDERLGPFYELLMAQSTNARASSSRDRVLPVSIMSRSTPSQLVSPSKLHFPGTVIEFWSLQSPRRSKNVHILDYW